MPLKLKWTHLNDWDEKSILHIWDMPAHDNTNLTCLPSQQSDQSGRLHWGARWPSGRASNVGARGRGFDTYLRRVVSLSKDTFTPRKVLVIHRKRWLRRDMAEKLFTGTLSLNKTKKQQDVYTAYPVFTLCMKLHWVFAM